MQNLYIYLGKQLLVAGILLGYYWLALRNTRFHYYNRFYLIASFVLSLLIPTIDLNWFAVEPPQNYAAQQLIYFIDQPGTVILPEQVFSWEKMGLYTALSVSLLLIGIMLLGVKRIYHLKKKSTVTSMDGFDFIETTAEDAPFSFFSNLFWRKDISLDDITGKNILSHELTHIREFHTHDKIFVAFFTHVFWMNPFFWVLRKELSLIHEFIADEKSVQQADASALAAMLLTTYDHPQFINSGQSFFYSSIKRRLNMLTSSKKTSYSYLRRILILPVAMGMLLLLSFTLAKKSSPQRNVSDSKLTEITHVSNEGVFTSKGTDSVPVPAKNKEYRVKSVGDSLIFLDAKSGKYLFKVHNSAIAPPPPPPLTLKQLSTHSNFLMVVNGIPMTKEEVNKIPQNTIETIDVRKGKDVQSLYGTKAKEGVLFITTNPNKNKQTDTFITVTGRPMRKLQGSDSSQNKTITVIGHPLSDKEDAKTSNLVTFDKEIAMIALDKGKDVTITVSNENGKNKYTIKNPVIKEQKLPEGLIYIVNGKRVNVEEFKTITPDKIKSINVLKGKSAKEKYGTEGENGVLEVELK